MPKIKDLGVGTVPDNKMQCSPTDVCSKKLQCSPTDVCSAAKNARGLPHYAVDQLRQQLQHQIRTQSHN